VARPGLVPLLVFSLASCTSNHHVSPFAVDPALYLAPRPDLEGQLARAERETRGSGLVETTRVQGKLAGGDSFVALGYQGRALSGEVVHATRVVTPFAVVLAEGPETDASRPTELVPFVFEKAYPSGLDLTGDGVADVVLRAGDGRLAVYRVDGASATPYPLRIASPPNAGRDENGDGRFDLVSTTPVPPGDAIGPRLVDVAINDGESFRDDHPDALAFHGRQRKPVEQASAPPARRLGRALENAFHEGLSGADAKTALAPALELAASLAPLSPELAVSWVRWRGFVTDTLARPRRSLPEGP
jgi:hypothetical protein